MKLASAISCVILLAALHAASASSSDGSSAGAGGLWEHAHLKWGEYNAAESDPHNIARGELECLVEGPSNITYRKEKGPHTFYLVPTRFCLRDIDERSTVVVNDDKDLNVYEEFISYTFYRFDNWTMKITLNPSMLEGDVTLSMFLFRGGRKPVAKKVHVRVINPRGPVDNRVRSPRMYPNSRQSYDRPSLCLEPGENYTMRFTINTPLEWLTAKKRITSLVRTFRNGFTRSWRGVPLFEGDGLIEVQTSVPFFGVVGQDSEGLELAFTSIPADVVDEKYQIEVVEYNELNWYRQLHRPPSERRSFFITVNMRRRCPVGRSAGVSIRLSSSTLFLPSSYLVFTGLSILVAIVCSENLLRLPLHPLPSESFYLSRI